MTDEHQREQVRQSADRLSLSDRTEFPSHDAVVSMMRETALQAVEGTLRGLGIDTTNPISAQQDFARLRSMRKLMEDEAFLADLAFVRRWRMNTERIGDTGVRSFVRWLIVGGLALIVMLSKDFWITHFKG